MQSQYFKYISIIIMKFILKNRLETLRNELELVQYEYKTEKTNIIIREVCIDIWNIFINEKTNQKLDKKPDFTYMSESYYKKWVAAGKSAKVMTKVGICEHKTPMAVLRERMNYCQNTKELFELLLNHLIIVWITHEEDHLLKVSGYNKNIPLCGADRYSLVGIKVIPDLIKYKNLKN